jgi:formate hydrogenlyase subunit 6/NADH:ubiquinone oxidoreductase subunit I
MHSYFDRIYVAIRSTVIGAKLSFRHFRKAIGKKQQNIAPEDNNYFTQTEGIVTLQYPHEKLPLPDNARYTLHNEIEDCIVCDKCAKICPVDCIAIETVKATEQIGTTSDGTPIRLYAAKFDIDMAKCCFCGLCTTVCPTECLTMTKEYDFAVFDVQAMNIPFSVMTEEQITEKKQAYEIYQTQKANTEKEKLQAANEQKITEKPISKVENTTETVDKQDQISNTTEVPKTRPVFKPKMK